ncbi:MAG TPA: glycosyltransferase family 2 protein [Phycisphaerales bacterium]|nr:glycosyltransferase family 2 protein [Phycisphaerales bacterium]
MPTGPELSVIVLSYNRRDALLRTLAHLAADAATGRAETIVVDNASSDGSADAVRNDFPDARVVALPTNTGVAGFNTGAALARGRWLLLLDDDAWPDAGVVERALAAYDADGSVGAIALLPVHPRVHAVEWPFATTPDDRFPFMGCGNIVRREAWDDAGGYEEAFFLYRNDTDLALSILETGRRVVFNPAWRVWHDSPVADRKSERWLRLATRNWLWLCARHGDAPEAALAGALGVARAVVAAGPSPSRLLRVAQGVLDSVRDERPRRPAPARGALGRVLEKRLARK